ncbi:MAG: hypothetical protein JXM73_17135 [Anaerolineae bacterium]|nr:hypothetical protein [Anaerolineae bacterium]
MTARIQVDSKVVYSKRKATKEEEASGVVYQPDGCLSRPELVNRTIEDRKVRAAIPEGAGRICISIQPGEKLGQMCFNVQFEGRREEGRPELYDFTADRHNELLLAVSDWLQSLFGELGTDFVADLESSPCPETDHRIFLDLAAQVLDRSVSVSLAKNELDVQVDAQNLVKEEVTEGSGHSSTITHTSS